MNINKNRSGFSILSLTLGYSLVLCMPAFADQCSYISKEQATTAITRLDINQTIYKLCEPCGENQPEFTKVQNLSMVKVDFEDYWQIEVNGQGIDLAYVFIDSGIENRFVNLAAIADCPATSVSPLLPPNLVQPPSKEEEFDI